MPRPSHGLCRLFPILAALMTPAALAQVTVTVDRLDGSEPGTPVPINLIVIDVFVDVATTDVWTASGMRGVTSNGATLVYAGAGGPSSLLNPGLANRFVTCLSKPRLRNADARFNNAGAAAAGPYDPPGPNVIATSTELNVTWFASPPETAGSPSFDGYIARIVLDLSAAGVDPASVVVVGSLTPPPGTVALFESRRSTSPTLGTVAATFDFSTPVGITWGVYGHATPPATGACCTPAGCTVLTQPACTAAGGSYAGDNVPCGALQYAPPISCVFQNISTIGSLAGVASACDDCGEPVPIGFTFSFFASAHTSVNVCSNGYLTFGPVLNAFTNDPAFPNPAAPNDMIAPYWDDWNPSSGGGVFYTTLGTAPNRRFIVQWQGVRHFGNTTTATFEVILSESSNKIEFAYALTNPSDTPTIGIENAAGTVGVNVPVGTQGPCTTIVAVPTSGPCHCACDFNADGTLNSQDFFGFLQCFFSGCP